MDSPGLIAHLKLRNRFLPLWGVIVDDLKQGVRHWAFLWWAALSLLLSVVWFIETPKAETPETVTSHYASTSSFDDSVQPFGAKQVIDGPRASTLAGKAIRLHLFLWATLVIALAGSSLAAEAETVAESVFCRGISRWQYFVGKMFSRMTLAVAGFVAFTLVSVGLALVKCHNDLSFAGTTAALMNGAMLLALVAALCVAGSSWFRNALFAFAVAWMAVYGFAIVVGLLQIETLSPLRFIETVIALPRHPEAPMVATSLLSTLGMGAIGAALISLFGLSYRDY